MVYDRFLGGWCAAVVSLALGWCWGVGSPATAEPTVQVTTYGHSALLFESEEGRLLINPFRAVACAAGLAEPRLAVDLILASSSLPDEGAPVARGLFLNSPGSYRLADDWQVEGFAVPHDHVGGHRFGEGVVWTWRQAGLRMAHMGGAALPPTAAQRILLSGVDVLVVAVGGGSKVLDGVQAAQVVGAIKPRLVIPVQYATAPPPEGCDLATIDPFLEALPAAVPVERPGPTVVLSDALLGDGTAVHVLELDSR
ncbi:MAG: MBL fold metallo-hydrolase [Synechococcus sp. SB0668_bin_15]|nr:MBL fold metallo-hydrolase [Synechococcus sp. SB0668_bin_15]MXZ82500.1 MBL fold metallo-hydrolase [Synechococcus sp. SB0666_bin_14]MYC49890.1 MBL fold metallo-hydrolase [Synechococcus sp. SB0662_bin_14]MYJ59923.1 MBL fold metallo-hydrolase [Synechococcus sp. SB0672_bin_6]